MGLYGQGLLRTVVGGGEQVDGSTGSAGMYDVRWYIVRHVVRRLL